MPAKKRNGSNNSSGIGSMSTKQLKRKKPINTDIMVDIKPLTKNQEKFFEAYKKGKNIFSYGAAGTGKTFIALYLALKDVLNQMTPYEKVYIVRSLVSTREIGFFLLSCLALILPIPLTELPFPFLFLAGIFNYPIMV